VSYTEVSFRIDPLEPWREILMVELGELGFESFEENQDGLKAYIRTADFKQSDLRSLVAPNDPHTTIDWVVREVQDENWNAVWEEAFKPVRIGERVLIRAEHHETELVEHDLVIQPRMAFGTGHHATTSMMVQAMLDTDMIDKDVCDLGCGTAVLAILAERLGAARVLAIDNDNNAVENACENVKRNDSHRITVEKGDVSTIEQLEFDIILANIQRNVLSEGMPTIASSLRENGRLFLSGFIVDDIDFMAGVVRDYGLKCNVSLQKGEWALLGCWK
jgi:ribosomal protein L11 methyltransferase